MFPDFDLNSLSRLRRTVTSVFTAENPEGKPGCGGSAEDGYSKSRGEHLGVGWKYAPCVQISPGRRQVLMDIDGPGTVKSMWFADGASRQILLRVYYDGQSVPSVVCPLTEFFAYSWRRNVSNYYEGPFFQLSSLPVAVNPNRGYNCFWPMPFRKHCRIEIENRSDADYACFYRISCAMGDIPDDAAYFHAQFRRLKRVPAGQAYCILDGVQGKGHYVGTAMFVEPSDQPYWWGEGEVKIWVDENGPFPTICGTGTEDYFGGAFDWTVEGCQKTYSTAFMGMHQLIADDARRRYSMYRWHIADPICFQSSIRVEIQDLGWEIEWQRYLQRSDDFASVAYWYQTLPTAPFPAVPENEAWRFE